ncbi:MAG: four helix bundle protein [Chthoniobacterales bacterium]
MEKKKTASKFDLEERLLEFSVRIIRLSEKLPKNAAGLHVAGQILRSGTSPYANHGEAQAAESVLDFIHKFKICLKELRETYRWLRLIQRAPLIEKPERIEPLVQESDELIRIFNQSILTAKKKSPERNPR